MKTKSANENKKSPTRRNEEIGLVFILLRVELLFLGKKLFIINATILFCLSTILFYHKKIYKSDL